MTNLEDRVKVLADNIIQGGYSHAQLMSIVTSFVKAFANPEAAVKLSKVQLIVEDSKSLVHLASSDLAQKMGSKDPTVKDMQTILDMLDRLVDASAEPLVFGGLLTGAGVYRAGSRPLTLLPTENYVYLSKVGPATQTLIHTQQP